MSWLKRWWMKRKRVYVPAPCPEAIIGHKTYYRVTPVRRTA